MTFNTCFLCFWRLTRMCLLLVSCFYRINFTSVTPNSILNTDLYQLPNEMKQRQKASPEKPHQRLTVFALYCSLTSVIWPRRRLVLARSKRAEPTASLAEHCADGTGVAGELKSAGCPRAARVRGRARASPRVLRWWGLVCWCAGVAAFLPTA